MCICRWRCESIGWTVRCVCVRDSTRDHFFMDLTREQHREHDTAHVIGYSADLD